MCCCDSNELSPPSAARLTLATLAWRAVCSDSVSGVGLHDQTRKGGLTLRNKEHRNADICLNCKQTDNFEGKRQCTAKEVGTPRETQGMEEKKKKIKSSHWKQGTAYDTGRAPKNSHRTKTKIRKQPTRFLLLNTKTFKYPVKPTWHEISYSKLGANCRKKKLSLSPT